MDSAEAKAAVVKARAVGGPAQAAAASAAPAASVAPGFFAALGKRLADKPELGKELGAVALFKITGPDST